MWAKFFILCRRSKRRISWPEARLFDGFRKITDWQNMANPDTDRKLYLLTFLFVNSLITTRLTFVWEDTFHAKVFSEANNVTEPEEENMVLYILILLRLGPN